MIYSDYMNYLHELYLEEQYEDIKMRERALYHKAILFFVCQLITD